MKQKTIRLSRIKISEEFIKHPPASNKIACKYARYIYHRKLDTQIILDKKNNLIDGYTSYLIAKMFGIRKVEVIILVERISEKER